MSTKKTEEKSEKTERASDAAARLVRTLIEEDPRLRELGREALRSDVQGRKTGETPVQIYRQRLRD